MPPQFFREIVINISLLFDKKSKEHIPLLCSIACSFRLPTLCCHWLTRLPVIRLMKSNEVLCLISAAEHEHRSFLGEKCFLLTFMATQSSPWEPSAVNTEMIQARGDSFAWFLLGTRKQTAGHPDQLKNRVQIRPWIENKEVCSVFSRSTIRTSLKTNEQWKEGTTTDRLFKGMTDVCFILTQTNSITAVGVFCFTVRDVIRRRIRSCLWRTAALTVPDGCKNYIEFTYLFIYIFILDTARLNVFIFPVFTCQLSPDCDYIFSRQKLIASHLVWWERINLPQC